MVSVERIARNAANARRPDNRGIVGRSPGPGVARLESTAAVGAIVRAIRKAGVPARVSINAGDYVCNHLYYGALAHLAAASSTTPAVFIHLPATPGQTPKRASAQRLASADAARALKAAVSAMIA
jgi:pyroglutamyl-peptidase